MAGTMVQMRIRISDPDGFSEVTQEVPIFLEKSLSGAEERVLLKAFLEHADSFEKAIQSRFGTDDVGRGALRDAMRALRRDADYVRHQLRNARAGDPVQAVLDALKRIDDEDDRELGGTPTRSRPDAGTEPAKGEAK